MDVTAKKKVNVNAKKLLMLSQPVVGNIKNLYLTVEEIRICLDNEVYVEEILNDGSTIKLTYANYSKDNNKKIKSYASKLIEPNKETSIEEMFKKRKSRSILRTENKRKADKENQENMKKAFGIK